MAPVPRPRAPSAGASANKRRAAPRMQASSSTRMAGEPRTEPAVVCLNLRWVSPDGASREDLIPEVNGPHRNMEAMLREAPWWNYALLHRERWRGTRSLAVAQQWRAIHLWNQLFEHSESDLVREPNPILSGATKKAAQQRRVEPRARALNRLDGMSGETDACSSRHGRPLPAAIEVLLRYQQEETDWAYRVIPWEFVISSVIKGIRPHEMNDVQRVPIVRRIERESEAASTTAPRLSDRPQDWRVMIVLSAPAFISRVYELNSEVDAVLDNGLNRDRKGKARVQHVCYLWNPTFDSLKAQIAQFKPDIVHFAGLDTHQALAIPESGDYSEEESQAMRVQLGQVLLDTPQEPVDHPSLNRDGYCLLHAQATQMQGIGSGIECVPYTRLPELFSNHPPALVCWNLYHSGNRTAALTVAEGYAGASIGFQDFVADEVAEEYFEEFYAALSHTRGQVTEAHALALGAVWRLKGSVRGAGIVLWTGYPTLDQIDSAAVERMAMSAGSRHVAVSADKSIFDFAVKVPEGLNYARLHHNQSPFERFRIGVRKPHRVNGMDVEVRLNGEDRDLVWRRRLDLVAPFVDLAPEIAFPLTATVARSCRESVMTTVHVRVACGDDVLFSRTYKTRILPPDQWNFALHSAHSLSSFVFPRDPQVEQLILASQKNMRVLRDNALAGFEGYQAETPEEVDLQVQAIWATLLHEYRLGYINPPPVYSRASDSQRLRTPTMVLKGGWGTCIDLTLLLAAAMELVDVYPVIIVLKTHAFVGYWRSPESRLAFLKVNDAGWTSRDKNNWDFVPRKPVNGMFMTSSLHEVRHYVHGNDLVVLETTYLTTLDSFAAAIDAAQGHLVNEAEFDYMIDLISARAAGITPLPLAYDRHEGDQA